ncbi:uncharacterized protein LOC124935257 [Impatiens glandulifera]|uniref:uncharacterized protein LOC124935257 n=1 Tax=Impatiens glandulifera TaxID=253017 RepID=UPI001FB17103|nr:uncharacterized protein LOC124935257 [Impatiens glandulifera]
MASFVNTSKLSLKIFYDKKSKKVLFAEADKEAVDFLVCILSLPLTTVTRLLSKSVIRMVGCLNNFRESVSNMHKINFPDGENKVFLLKPLHSCSVQAPFLLPDRAIYKIYKCSTHNYKYTISSTENGKICSCLNGVPIEGGIVKAGSGIAILKGYVKYIVMDNLLVKPISSMSRICLLKDFNVKDLGNVHEIVVDLGFDEGLMILKAAMEGESVFTSVFLQKLV